MTHYNYRALSRKMTYEDEASYATLYLLHDMTHSYVCHDSFARVTRLLYRVYEKTDYFLQMSL